MSSDVPYSDLIRDAGVHGSLYADPRVFADEMKHLFQSSWLFVGHESEIPNPGDWVRRRLGGQSVLLVRGRDGKVRTLANRCAHRGTALCWEESGNTRIFRCTYHAWSYDLDGQLAGVPHPAGLQGTKADYTLDRPAEVESYRGFVFARWSTEGVPLVEFLGLGGTELLDRICDLSPTGRIELRAGWIGHRVESNWKLWYESNNDGYHFRFVHASLIAATGAAHYQDAVLGAEEENPSRAVDRGNGHSELDFRPGYRTPLAWLGTDPEKVADYRLALHRAHGEERAEQLLWDGPPHAMIFPNLFLGEMNLMVIEPIAHDQTILRHTAIGFEGADDAFNQRTLRQSEAALGPASFIVPDDAVTAERMQSAFRGSSSCTGTDRGWVDLSRGLDRERSEASGSRSAHISDETPNRAFWREYRRAMVQG